jgi:hypothetical protein
VWLLVLNIGLSIASHVSERCSKGDVLNTLHPLRHHLLPIDNADSHFAFAHTQLLKKTHPPVRDMNIGRCTLMVADIPYQASRGLNADAKSIWKDE